MAFLYGIGILAAVLIVWFIAVYNSLVKLNQRTDEAFSDIDVQLKRRYDLIPNLVETVKGYATHEKDLFEKVAEARAKAMGAEGIKAKGEAENALSGTLKTLFAVSENYPELKANQNFLELQRELSDTENKIQSSRRFYNTNVRDLNIKTKVFPSSIAAGILGMKEREFFEANEGERENVNVKF